MSENAKASSVNRAKLYQLVLFPLNNGATNVYYVLVLSYIATFGSNVLALGTLFASVMVTAMRLCDAITDPIIGALMDRTNGKFGKFRPFMAIGNLIMAASILVLYGITPDDPRYDDVGTLCRVCGPVLCLGHRLHLPDQLHPFRSDGSDQRPQAAPAVHDLQHRRQSAGHGRYAVPGSHPCQKL